MPRGASIEDKTIFSHREPFTSGGLRDTRISRQAAQIEPLSYAACTQTSKSKKRANPFRNRIENRPSRPPLIGADARWY